MINEKIAAELKLGTIIADWFLINILTPHRVSVVLQIQKTILKNCNLDTSPSNFYVKILLDKVKEHEILNKMVSFISVLGSILVKIIVHFSNLKNLPNHLFIKTELINA